jgi:acetoacetyl-CoA synthetase
MSDHAAGLDKEPIWRPAPEAAQASAMAAFFRSVAGSEGTPRTDAPYAEWHAWSVAKPEKFWGSVWRFTNVISDERAGRAPWEDVLRNGERMMPPRRSTSGVVRARGISVEENLGPIWFPGASLNFAENLLRRRDDTPAIIARDETGARREISFNELATDVRRTAGALRALGVGPGDRVAGFLPNIPEAVIGALAAASLGAVWSSCSPDFGAQGVLDRFGQIEPRVLIVADGYRYAGKRIDTLVCAREIAAALPSILAVVIVPFLGEEAARKSVANPDLARDSDIDGAVAWDDFLSSGETSPEEFERLPFDHPLYIMYSSGTTGLPKCMVHGAGGTLLQHLKEHRLHCDLRAGERIFYFTTCGWMMWNWLVSALASEATIVLYDGAPMPEARPDMLWRVAAEERVAVFGTSAKFLALSQKAGIAPARWAEGPRLGALRSILSTGSPLAGHSYDFVDADVKPGVHVGSISGGTDIISCFALANPMLPVWRGELQCRGLGMAVDVWDEEGKPLRGGAGELVCTRPFPSMPVGFWSDDDGSRYRAAYFSHFKDCWRHGDWAELTEHDGLVIHGRSDATLNPGGVRIGTAEIYRQVEQLPEVIESVVVGQDVKDGVDTDVRIVLFVRLQPGVTLDDALRERIKRAIRAETSPHHVPKVIEAVDDIPRTISGKISEIAVRDVIHGRTVKNTDALANPKSLELYRRWATR